MTMSMKEFLKNHEWLRISVQYSMFCGGSWEIKVYNTTWDLFEPVFKHIITDEIVENVNLDFEAVIMAPVLDWYNSQEAMKNELP